MCLLLILFFCSWTFALADFVLRKVCRGNRAFCVKCCNFVGVKTVSAQNRTCVFAVERRAGPHLARRLRELDRQSNSLDAAERRMLDLDHHLARDRCRLAESWTHV